MIEVVLRPAMTETDSSEKPSLGLFSIFKSVLAAGFGVQKDENRVNDFKHGKAIHFIVAGLIATVMFLLAMWGLVQLVLMSAA